MAAGERVGRFVLTAAPLAIWYAGTPATLGPAARSAEFGRGLLLSALLSLLLGGIGLVIAALAPRRGFAAAAVIAVPALWYGTVAVFSPVTSLDAVRSWWPAVRSDLAGGHGPPNAAAGTVYLLVAAVAGATWSAVHRLRRPAPAGEE